MGQVYPQKLTAKVKNIYLDVIKTLLITVAKVRPNLTNIRYTYYDCLAQMWMTKVSMSQLV